MSNKISFFDLLQHLISPNNQIRQDAEKYYNQALLSSPDEAIGSLMQVLSDSNGNFHLRQLAAVLLRRCLIDEEESYFFKLQQQTRNYLIQELSRLLQEEVNTAIRIKVCEIAGDLGGNMLEPKDWPSLYPTTVNLCKSMNVADREVGLSLIGILTESALVYYQDFLPTVKELLAFNIQGNANDGKGLTLSIKALNDVIGSIKSSSHLEELKDLVLPLFQSINTFLQQSKQLALQPNLLPKQNHQFLCTCFEYLIDIADHSSIFYNNHLQFILFPLLDYLDNETFLTFSLRSLIVEFLVTLCIHENKKIKKLSKNVGGQTQFLTRFIGYCLSLMSQLEDDPNWEMLETVEEINYDSSYNDIGESALRRCLASFPIKNTYSIITSLLSTYLTNTEWKKIYSGLQCISCYVEVTIHISNKTQLLLHRKEIFTTLQFFINHQNSHPRVRYIAFYALSQFLLYHGQEITNDQFLDILRLLKQHSTFAMNKSARIRRNVLITLIQLIDITSTQFIINHCYEILEIIVYSLQEGPTIVQESCISAIISIAETTKGQDLWIKFYPSMIPILKDLLTYSYRKGLESLWCQTLECISVLGESAGKSLFYPDALELMDLLTKLQSSLSNDPQNRNNNIETTLIKSWVRIGRCLGSEFLPYLPSIMEKLFQALSQDIMVNGDDDPNAARLQQKNQQKQNLDNDEGSDYDLNLAGDDMDDDDDDEDGDGDDNDYQMIETDQGWITVRTSAVEEQSSALQMILLLTEKLQEYYYPYIEQTMQLLTKLLSSPNEDIRSYSIVILPELIRATGRALPLNRNPLKELTFYSLGKILHFLENESSLDLIMTGLQAMRQILMYACMDWNEVMIQQQKTLPIPTVPTQMNLAGGSNNNNGIVPPPPPASSSSSGLDANSSSSVVVFETNLQEFLLKEDKKTTNWIKLLDDQQMISISQCLKTILRESLQRRAILKAEKQLEEREDAEADGNGGARGGEGGAGNDVDDGEEFFPLDPTSPSPSKGKNKKKFTKGTIDPQQSSVFAPAPGSDDIHNKDTFEVEDFMEEENLFFQQSLELHFNISEVINILFQTHSFHYFQIYYQEFHELLFNFTHVYCNLEDKRFAFLIISDVIEFGLSPAALVRNHLNNNPDQSSSSSSSSSLSNQQQIQQQVLFHHKEFIENYLKQLLPILHSYCTTSIPTNHSDQAPNHNEEEIDYELLRTIVYILGIIYELYSEYFPILLNSFLTQSLISLHQLMSFILSIEQQMVQDKIHHNHPNNNHPQNLQEQEDDKAQEEVVGLCKDNIISSIGLIAQKLVLLTPSTEHNPSGQSQQQPNEVYLGQNIIQPAQMQYLLTQWLQLLPLAYDIDEDYKIMKSIFYLFQHGKFYSYLLQHPEIFVLAISVFLKEINQEKLNKNLLFFMQQLLYEIFSPASQRLFHFMISNELITFLSQHLSTEENLQLQNLLFSFPSILSQRQQEGQQQQLQLQQQQQQQRINGNGSNNNGNAKNVLATSPLATAPIYDVLLKK